MFFRRKKFYFWKLGEGSDFGVLNSTSWQSLGPTRKRLSQLQCELHATNAKRGIFQLTKINVSSDGWSETEYDNTFGEPFLSMAV